MATYFGIVTSVKATSTGSTWALVQGLTRTAKINVAVSTDASGDVDAYQTSGKEIEVKASVVYDSAEAGAVGVGSLLYVGGYAYLIESFTDTETNTGWNTAEITARRWVNNTVPAAI